MSMKNLLSTPFEPAKKPKGLVHAIVERGHRRSYVETLSQMLDYSGFIEPLSIKSGVRLVRADNLVIATFDDSPLIYGIVVALRAVRGRRTAALFLRPQTCMRRDHPKFRMKKLLYRLLCCIPGLTLITITPHDWHPSLAQVSHVGTYDPQYWDLHDGETLRLPRQSLLSAELAAAAAGRAIIVLPGFVSREKGFEYLTRIVATEIIAQAPIVVVVAGAVASDMASTADAFQQAGGILVDRELCDNELESLYTISSVVWACYVPDYDQASGIFGRAFQTGKPVLVREGSLISNAAQDLGARALPLPYGDANSAAKTIISAIGCISGEQSRRHHGADLDEKVLELRKHFIKTIRSAFDEDDSDDR